ncbi:hypothetical protein WJX82_006637 [Trebouxia sp. C0006]
MGASDHRCHTARPEQQATLQYPLVSSSSDKLTTDATRDVHGSGPRQPQAAQYQLADGVGFQTLNQRRASLLSEENVPGIKPVVEQLQQAFSSHQEKQKSFQAALVAELLALGNQVDAMQTQQQLRLTDTAHTSSSPPAWLSLTPKIQQAHEEVQAVKCDVANLEQLLSRLTQRMEAHDQQNLERSQQWADLNHKQWTECRRDVDVEAKLLQKVQQAQKSGIDQRLALLESSLVQSLDSSLASQSGLAHRVNSGLQDLSHSIKQDQASQAAWEQAVVQDILGGMAALRFFCRDLEQSQQQGLAHLHFLHQSDQAQGNIQAQQNLALTLRLHSLQTQLQAVKGHSSSSQSQAEEQQGLLLAAQRKLYTQQSRLIDSVELLRREVESLAVEQTLQSSIADAEMTQQSQAATSADREAVQSLQTQLSSLQLAAKLAAASKKQHEEQQAWVASQFSGFQVQLGDILSSQVADALATERTKTDTDIAQVRPQLLDDGVTSRSASLAESQQLLSQMTAQEETLRAEITERIASALQEHNSDVAHQVGLLGQQINAAMIAKQDQLAAAITQLKDTLHNEVEERLQGSLDLLKSTVTSSADALKAHFESELLSLRSTVSQLEGRAGRAGAEPSSAAQSKAWAADMDTLVNHVNAALESVHSQVAGALRQNFEDLTGKLEGPRHLFMEK